MRTKTFQVLAFARKRGAIGSFGVHEWEIVAFNEEQAKELWFAAFSQEWELNHFTAVKEIIND